MIPRTFEIERNYGDYPNSDRFQHDTNEPVFTDSRGVSWGGLAFVGGLLATVGYAILDTNLTIGGGVLLIGLVLLIGAGAGKKWEEDEEILEDFDYQWERDIDAEIEARQIENNLRDRSRERQKEIDEIVKAVKATIKVRCRYCGMLNEEKANKCESCGGSL